MTEQYLPRTVSTIASDEMHQKQSGPLESFFTSRNRKIILFGDAQSGKTSELEHLAEVFEKMSSNYVVPFLLYKYQGDKSLEEQIPIPKLFPEGSRPCFLLDGLDEVKEAWKNKVLSEIVDLSEVFNSACFLITCRTNYESSLRRMKRLHSFLKLRLDGLDFGFVREYFRLHADEPERLFEQVINYKYGFIRANPFFLKEVVCFFNEKRTLPLNKADIHEYFVDKALDIEAEKHYTNRVSALREKISWESFLGELAFCLVDCQQMEASLADLIGAFPSIADEPLDLSSCPLLRVTKDDKVSFIHNAFREYLAAVSMKELDFKSIMNVVCYPNTDTLIPSWIQVLMFLLPILKKTESKSYDELLSWMLTHYVNLVVRCGGDFIEESVRTRVFRELYQSDWGDTDTLMRFANTKESIDLVIQQIKDGDLRMFRYLSAADLSFRSPEELEWLRDKALEIIEDKDKRDGRDIYDVFYWTSPFENNALKSHRALESLVRISDGTGDDFLCSATMEVIAYLGLEDKYANYIFRNQDFIDTICGAFLAFKEEKNIRRALMVVLKGEIPFKINALEQLYEGLVKKLTSGDQDRMVKSMLSILDEIRDYPYMLEEYGFLYMKWFLANNMDTVALADQYLGEMRTILSERYKRGDDRFQYEEYNRCSSVLALLINKTVCKRKIKGDETGSLNSEIILNCVLSNPFLVDTQMKYHPWEISCDLTQQAIDSLFDKETMREEIREIYEYFKNRGINKVISTDLWNLHACNRRCRSAFHFLLDFRHLWSEWNGSKWSLDLSAPPFWIDDEVYSTQFILGYLAKKKDVFFVGAVSLKDDQKAIIASMVSKVLRDPVRYYDNSYFRLTHAILMDVIAVFRPELSQVDLALLVPFFTEYLAPCTSNTPKEKDVRIADYVLDRIKEYDFFKSVILSFLESDDNRDEKEFARVAYEGIISRRVRPLYPCLLPLLKHCSGFYGYSDLIKLFPGDRDQYELLLGTDNDKLFLSTLIELKKEGMPFDETKYMGRLEEIARDSEDELDERWANDLLASFGRPDALIWLIEHKKVPSASALDRFGADYLPKIEQLLVSLYRHYCEDDLRCHDANEDLPIKNALLRIACETEELRDHVVSFLREKAGQIPNYESTLNAFADKVYLAYFEAHSVKRTLCDSSARIKTSGILTRWARG